MKWGLGLYVLIAYVFIWGYFNGIWKEMLKRSNHDWSNWLLAHHGLDAFGLVLLAISIVLFAKAICSSIRSSQKEES